MQHILETLIKQNRTCRRFDEQTPVEALQIKRWLNVIRYTASMRNAQPLKYIIVTDPEECNQITALQHWAAMLPDWDGPAVGERPRAYLIQLLDTTLAPSGRFDEGLQLQALGLLATDAGYGMCIFHGYGKGDIARMYDLPTHLSINAVIALGRPMETIILEEARNPEDVKYWRDAEGKHHVPKRPLEELIVEPHKPSLF